MSTHLEEYLAYYSTLDSPGYAVLVTGDWGTGKTHQVKNCIPEEKRIYVSLFGVQSFEQLSSEVIAANSPYTEKAKRLFSDYGKYFFSLIGNSGLIGAAPSVLNAVMRRNLKKDKILIFDDLERSNLLLKDKLGAINYYVEQLGFRVIVIANDKKLFDDIAGEKEKIFGQTIRVNSQIDEAFDDFISQLSLTNQKKFIIENKILIKNIFDKSGENSLRILRHVIKDLVRLQDCLKTNHLKNIPAMEELIQEFVAFDVEIRSGNLCEKDLIERNDYQAEFIRRAIINTNDNEEKSPLDKISTKYSSINFINGMLNDEVVNLIFIKGQYIDEKIQKSINSSSHFLIPENDPPWKIIFNFDRIEDNIVDSAVEKMELQFKNREIINPGEILHIFCLRLLMANNGVINFTKKEIISQSKKYIDDLLDDNKIPPREIRLITNDRFRTSYDGYQYWVDDSDKGLFEEIFGYLTKSQEEAFQRTVPAILEDLLYKIRHDPEAFFEAVSPTVNGTNPYAETPMLHKIPAYDFVNAWLCAKPEKRRFVEYAFQGRYEAGALNRFFEQEKHWALEVLKELDRRASVEKGFRALRMKRMRPRILISLAK